MTQIQRDFNLKAYNSFGVDASAQYFAEINSVSDLAGILAQKDPSWPLLIMGGGSNMLFVKPYAGLVIKMNIQGIQVEDLGKEVIVTAGAGVNWHEFVLYCVHHGYAGIENLSLIPGSVGASPVQNIGAYGVELMDVFHACEAYEIATGKMRTFLPEDCKFSYRESVFKAELKGQYIICSVSYKLHKTARIKTHYAALEEALKAKNITDPTIKDISDVVSEVRVSKLPDPSQIGNAGSFFKNPIIDKTQFDYLNVQFPNIVHFPAPQEQIKLAAGWLIESCGFKGIVKGNTGTWKNQALVIVNHGQASGKEVYDFSEIIINAVYEKFGIQLEREVNVI
ncbi:MAG: UDP-N-acetylmuramate dehydrogenase [Pedobacter sp.]|nr:MAG: UDP-N-acetylmuramate dehydrogenase [Pedobacter sp.]